MTGTAYPGDAVAGVPTYSATQGRTALAASMGGATAARPLGGISGVRPGIAGIATATSTTWTVTPFNGYIDLESPGTTGGYFFSFQANETGTVTAAAGSARVDLLYVQVSDSNTGDGSGLSPRAVMGYQAGTAGAGIPTLSAPRAFVIAQVNVPASGGGSPTVTWVAPYTVAAGGVLPAASSALYPASPYVGQYVDDASKGLLRWNGSAWGSPSGISRIIPTASTGCSVSPTGLVTFSGVSTFTILNVFSAAFNNYLIEYDVTRSAAGGDFKLQLAVAGAASVTGYDYGRNFVSGSSNTASNAGSTANYPLDAGVTVSSRTRGESKVAAPFLATPTGFYATAAFNDGGYYFTGGGKHQPATSYDSAVFSAATGNSTGTLSVFGFNDI